MIVERQIWDNLALNRDPNIEDVFQGAQESLLEDAF